MDVFCATTIFFSPSLYFSVISLPSTPLTICATVALVMVLFGIRSHGRWPSPVPRVAIEPTPVANLRPHPGNARTYSKKQIRQIADNIRHFGFNNPILIGEGGEIIAGHGRVEAAITLIVPFHRLQRADEQQQIPLFSVTEPFKVLRYPDGFSLV